MDDESEVKRVPPQEDEPEPELPVKTILTIVAFVCMVVLAIIISSILRQKTSPETECTYRGGSWDRATKECIYESGLGTGKEQVGMTARIITLTIPDSTETVQFEGVEIGTKYGTPKDFETAPSAQRGIISLISELGRVQKDTQDLVVPFAVQSGGSGVMIYLGIFKEEGDSYALADHIFVGDRISPQSVTLSGTVDSSYTAKFAYRDRYESEAMSAVPTEPRTVEVVVLDHRIDTSFVLGRDGVLYKNLLRVATPLPRTIITSPLTISGKARGPWFFEASFPIVLTDWDGKIVAEGHAEARGEWMTEDFVPFTATLNYTLPEDTPYLRGTLILRKDNPSGLPEHDDAFEIPIEFGR